MKRKLSIILLSVFALCGAGLILYPMLSNLYYEHHEGTVLTEYTEEMSEEDTSAELQAAQAYNESLLRSTAIVTDPFGETVSTSNNDNYENLLNPDGNGIMGYVEIPSINVMLPIYHGTDEGSLQNGVGHMKNTSLPIGGTGTHAVIAGHTGISNRRLFTDLAELEIGDVFYIHVLNEVLEYQVDNIATVLPSETELLRIDPEQDYVTLLTCTPYGVNDHRLLVRGTRIPYDPIEEDSEDIAQHPSEWTQQYLKALRLGGGWAAGITFIIFITSRLLWGRRKK